MFNYKLSFFLITIFVVFLYFVWRKYLLIVPQTLPSKPSFFVEGNDDILSGSFYEVSIPPTKQDWYSSADYRLWIPDDVKSIRGLIVMQHGCGIDAANSGLDHVKDLQWQALALKYQFALLGSKLSTSKNEPCEFWAITTGGSESAFLKALSLLGQKSNHPELRKIPWVLWGHSGGAEWVAQMMKKYPDRTIALIAARGGGYFLIETNSKLLEVPALFAAGEKDKNFKDSVKVPNEVFFRQRQAGAPWAFALEAKTGHEIANTRLLAIPYLDALINKRLTKDNNELRSIDQTQGWIGNIGTHEIVPANQYKGNPLKAAWLPNEETARKWQEYVTTGKVLPTRKPKAPSGVRVREIKEKEVLITWNHTPDLENGLPSFRIYRDNSLIQTLEGQSHGFHDTPNPTQITLEFRDRQGSVNSSYRVAAVNELGESLSPSQKVRQEL